MKLAHIAKHSHNIGEGALVDGLRNLIKQSSKSEVSFLDYDRKYFQSISGSEFSKDSVGLRLDKSFFQRLNKEADGLVIGGGGIIQSGKYDNFGGLCVAGDLKDYEELDIPVFLYALGDNRLKSEYTFEYVKEFESLIVKVSSNGGLCSVRNDGSFERLSEFVDERLMGHVEIIPDPGLFVSRSTKTHPLIQENKINVAIQLAGDRIEERLVRGDSRAQENSFLESIALAIYKLSQKYELNVIVCPHITTDYHITAKFLDICANYKIGNSSLAREIINVNFCTKGYEAAPDYFSVYDQSDLVLGMRGHSAICSVGLDTPFIGLNSHEKLGGFLNQMDLGQFSIDIVADDFEGRLLELTNSLLEDSSQWRILRDNSVFREKQILNKFNKKILGTFK